MSVHSTRRVRLSKEARREQILEAALQAFVAGGYHATHVEHVIQRAGVARGTFYLHFESKHAVFAALVDRVMDLAFRNQPPEPRAFSDAASYRAYARSAYRKVLETIREHRGLFRLLLEEAVGADKGFAERLEAFFQAWHARLVRRLALAAASGLARPGLDPDVTAEIIIGATERVARTYLLPEPAPDLDVLVEQLASFDLRSVLAAA